MFLLWSYVLEYAGSYFEKEKKRADSKTAILISGKKITLFNSLTATWLVSAATFFSSFVLA
jgi:hypothetical protein